MKNQSAARPFAIHPSLTGLALGLAVIVSSCAGARAAEGEGDATDSPYFRVVSAVPDGVDALPLVDTHVEVLVAGMIADVAIVQTYANEGSAPLEAIYVFPGSTRAAVHGLTMVVGDRIVRAKIQKRAEARRTYNEARASGRTASLLEQDRPNVFKMNLANILPGDEVRVELRYTELLEPDENGDYEFVFPTVVGPRYSERSAAMPEPAAAADEAVEPAPAPPVAVADRTGSTFGIDIRIAAPVALSGVQCRSHPVRIDTPTPRTARVILAPDVDPAAHANRDFILNFRLRGGAVQTGLLVSREPGADEGYFLAMIQPPARVEAADIPAREYIFVVDVSGSMNGFPLETSKSLLAGLVADLRPDDVFNIVLFAGGAAVLSPESLAATPENLAAAVVLLEQQRAGGGTQLLSALEAALALPRRDSVARTIVLVTDGYVDVEAETFDLVRRELGGASVFSFGIGRSVNRHLIEGLARAGQGDPCVVTDPSACADAVRRFRSYIESPVLTRVHATFDGGFQATEVTPAALPDVFAQRPVVLFGKWRGQPQGRIVLNGLGGRGAFSGALPLADAVVVEGSRALELLWARAQITALDDMDAGTGRTDPDRVEAITRLGLAHGLLTKHTSFVAVDEIVRNPGGESRTANQPVLLPDGVGKQPAASEVPTTPEPGTLGIAILSMLAFGWSVRRRMRAREKQG